MSDLAIRQRKVLAAFGTCGGDVKVSLLIGHEWFHALGVGHDFTNDLAFAQCVVAEVAMTFSPLCTTGGA